jgi:hypothetical protein
MSVSIVTTYTQHIIDRNYSHSHTIHDVYGDDRFRTDATLSELKAYLRDRGIDIDSCTSRQRKVIKWVNEKPMRTP